MWHTLLPQDTSFKRLDLGAYLFNNEADYIGFHCDFVSTAQMTLEASYGNIPVFNVFVAQTNVTGNIRTIGDIHSVGNITCNGFFSFNGTMNLTGVGNVAAKINANTALAAGKKSFDIPHPSKDGHRLRYICIEGPEAAVYYRGKLRDKNVIELPEYWKGLVDIDTITVNLTPFGSYQELFVEKIESETKIFVKNNLDGPISCDYTIWGERKDLDKLYVEYEGRIEDYPGDNSQRSIVGYNYDKREGIN